MIATTSNTAGYCTGVGSIADGYAGGFVFGGGGSSSSSNGGIDNDGQEHQHVASKAGAASPTASGAASARPTAATSIMNSLWMNMSGGGGGGSVFNRKRDSNGGNHNRTMSPQLSSSSVGSGDSNNGGVITMSAAEHTQNIPMLPPTVHNMTTAAGDFGGARSGTSSHHGSSSPITTSTITPKMADAFLAQTMNQLSIQERQQVYEDVHGVSTTVDETPEFIQDCLQQMSAEIQAKLLSDAAARTATATDDAASNNGVGQQQQCCCALQVALQQDYQYVMDLRIMFLRCEMYHVKHATSRMFAYFEEKLHLWGYDKLGRDILQSDFVNPMEREYLNVGFYQILPGKDSSGRTMMFSMVKESQRSDNVPAEDKLRALWYMVMKMLRKNVSTQKDGIVSIGYDCETREGFSIQEQVLVWKSCRLLNILPLRIASLHYCYSDPIIHALIALGTTALGARTRTRVRPHYGTHMEIMYELMTYGILPNVLPLEPSNDRGCDDFVLSLKNHQSFLARMRKEEEQEAELNRLSTSLANGHTFDHPSSLLDPASSFNGAHPVEKLSPLVLEQMFVQQHQQQHQAVSYVDPTMEKKCPNATDMNNSAIPNTLSSSSPTTTKSSQPQSQNGDNGRIIPNDLDVLLGRGRRPQSHPGNMRFHKVMEEFEEEYEMEDKFGKTVIAEVIVNRIKNEGGRFLRQDEVDWVVVSDSLARTRVGHGFRNLRLKRGRGNGGGGDTGSAAGGANSKKKNGTTQLTAGRTSILSTKQGDGDDNTKCGLFMGCNKRHRIS